MKRMLMLGGWTEIHERVKACGVDLTVIQPKDDMRPGDLPLVDAFLNCPMNDPLALALAEALHHARPFDFVHSFQEYGLMNAARIGAALGVQANPPGPVELVCDKSKMRMHMQEQGIPSIPFAVINSEHDVHALAGRCGFPLILKPAFGTASRQIHKLTAPEQVAPALASVLDEFPGVSPIAERFVEGPEISIEAISWDGRHTILACTDKLTSGSPYFVEIGHTQPSAHPGATLEKARALTTMFLESIGHRFGPSHTEIILSQDGPVIVESHTRTGGDRIFDMVELSRGVNMFEATVRGYVGKFPALHDLVERASAIRYLALPQGTVRAVSGVEAARVAPGVVRCEVDLPIGKEIRPFRNSVERHGFVLAAGATRDEAIANVDRALKLIDVDLS